MKIKQSRRINPRASALALAVSACCMAGGAHAVKLNTSPEWDVNFDNTVVYAAGWRVQGRDPAIANHFAYQSGDAKFDKGDMVTNRVSDLIEFQGIYNKDMGFRVSGSVFKDFAYNDQAKSAPGFISPYVNNTYTNATKREFVEGGEILDAFVFANKEVGGIPTYLKVGRLSQYWGNAFFFGFSNIAYSQQPIDFIKGFTQPGSEVKELFLPRKQILLTAELTPELSVSGQVFFEYRRNKYPEASTYLGFFDPLYDGPNRPLAGTIFASAASGGSIGIVEPKDNNRDWGLKVAYSPKWVGGDLAFYYREFAEVDPYPVQLAIVNGLPTIQSTVNEKAKLIGISFEKSFGLVSTGFELSQRRNTALNSTPFNVLPVGAPAATGTITNFIANTFVQLGSTALWNSGIWLAEFSYTQLNKVTGNPSMYFGEGYTTCGTGVVELASGNGTTWRDGCSTKRSLAFATLFEPQWLQVFPGIDLSAPMSLTLGVKGNPAYRASGFYGEGTAIYSFGVKATYQQKTTLSLSYNGYHWRTADKLNVGNGPVYYGNNAFGGIGAISLNDRGWIQMQLKTSF